MAALANRARFEAECGSKKKTREPKAPPTMEELAVQGSYCSRYRGRMAGGTGVALLRVQGSDCSRHRDLIAHGTGTSLLAVQEPYCLRYMERIWDGAPLVVRLRSCAGGRQWHT